MNHSRFSEMEKLRIVISVKYSLKSVPIACEGLCSEASYWRWKKVFDDMPDNLVRELLSHILSDEDSILGSLCREI